MFSLSVSFRTNKIVDGIFDGLKIKQIQKKNNLSRKLDAVELTE